MEYISETTDFRIAGCSAVSLGKFDGFHKGHQKLLERVLSKQKEGMRGVFFTFGQFPGNVLEHKSSPVVMTNSERKNYLEKAGLDVLVECPFIPEVIHMSPESFVKNILVDRLNAEYLVMGSDFRFGYKARGSADFLKECAPLYGFTVEIIDEVMYEGREVSSTFLRDKIAEGDMDTAERLLGRPYSAEGIINLRDLENRSSLELILPSEKLLPPDGLYKAVLHTSDVSEAGKAAVTTDTDKNRQQKRSLVFLSDIPAELLHGQKAEVDILHNIK